MKVTIKGDQKDLSNLKWDKDQDALMSIAEKYGAIIMVKEWKMVK